MRVLNSLELVSMLKILVSVTSNDAANLAEGAHQELFNLSERMRVNKLSPNPEKTGFMVIVHSLNIKNLHLPEGLKLNYSDIRRVDKTKSLRVIADEN